MRLIILLAFFCICLPSFILAQSLELTIPTGELPSDISSWESETGMLHITFSAPEAMQFRNAHIVFQATEGMEHILISTRDRFAAQPSITGTFRKKTFTFENIVRMDSAMIDPSYRSVTSPEGTLPGGLFSLCIYMVDSSGKQIGNIAQACTNFWIRDVDAPLLLAPSNEASYNGKLPLTFSWSPANVVSQTVHYHLKLYPIYEGQTPEQAMAGSSALYSSDDIFSTSFIYPSDAPSLASLPKVKNFAWIVTQYDQNGRPIGKNYGRSVPSVFYVQKN